MELIKLVGVLLVALVSWSSCQQQGGRLSDEEEELRLIQEQNRNAKYRFTSNVADGIMDNQHTRQESREEGKVVGQYSYSDGFFRRTVHYEADENGYRVVSEEVEPIGNGPQLNLQTGQAEVRTQFNGVDTGYIIRAEDLDLSRRRPFASPAPQPIADKARGGLQFQDE